MPREYTLFGKTKIFFDSKSRPRIRIGKYPRSRQKIKIDYKPEVKIRYGHGQKPLESIARLIYPHEENILKGLERIKSYQNYLGEIKFLPSDNQYLPYWQQTFFSPLDGATIYTIIADRKPVRFYEIGSGFSTMFARKAITDHNLATKIMSIDPEPRAEIDKISDSILRSRLEDIDLSVFDKLEVGDFIFLDGSHRSFQNSDVTVFFLEVLPKLPKGVIIGVHDILLPHDYPSSWSHRWYSEQYLLGAFWLGLGEKFIPIFPNYYTFKKYPDQVRQALPLKVIDGYENSDFFSEFSFGGTGMFFIVE